ncbi:MAG: hypothetical protein WCB18_07150 [Thermoplasmata archaeon]
MTRRTILACPVCGLEISGYKGALVDHLRDVDGREDAEILAVFVVRTRRTTLSLSPPDPPKTDGGPITIGPDMPARDAGRIYRAQSRVSAKPKAVGGGRRRKSTFESSSPGSRGELEVA